MEGIITLGKRLKKLREEKGLTQKQLAEIISMSQQTIGHYEVGRARPDLDTLQRLAEIFGCSIDFLLGNSNNRNYPHTQAAHKSEDAPLTEEDFDYIEKLLKKARDEFKKNK